MKPVSESSNCYAIVKSGWRDNFHIICEDPACGDLHHSHYFGSKKYIQQMFPFVKDEDFEKEE